MSPAGLILARRSIRHRPRKRLSSRCQCRFASTVGWNPTTIPESSPIPFSGPPQPDPTSYQPPQTIPSTLGPEHFPIQRFGYFSRALPRPRRPYAYDSLLQSIPEPHIVTLTIHLAPFHAYLVGDSPPGFPSPSHHDSRPASLRGKYSPAFGGHFFLAPPSELRSRPVSVRARRPSAARIQNPVRNSLRREIDTAVVVPDETEGNGDVIGTRELLSKLLEFGDATLRNELLSRVAMETLDATPPNFDLRETSALFERVLPVLSAQAKVAEREQQHAGFQEVFNSQLPETAFFLSVLDVLLAITRNVRPAGSNASEEEIDRFKLAVANDLGRLIAPSFEKISETRYRHPVLLLLLCLDTRRICHLLGESFRPIAQEFFSQADWPAKCQMFQWILESSGRTTHDKTSDGRSDALRFCAFFQAGDLMAVNKARIQGARRNLALTISRIALEIKPDLIRWAWGLFADDPGERDKLSRQTLELIQFGLRESQHQVMTDRLNIILHRKWRDGRRLARPANHDFGQEMKEHGQRGDMVKVRGVFEDAKRKSDELGPRVVRVDHLYVHLMGACVEMNDLTGAFDAFEEMKTTGYRPLVHHFNTLLRGCLARLDLTTALDVVAQMAKTDNVRPDQVTCNLLVSLYGERRDAEGAHHVMTEMQELHGVEPNSYIYTSLMNAHINSGNVRPALEIYRTLEQSKDPALQPNQGTFSVLLKAYVQLRAPVQILFRAFRTLSARGMTLREVVFTQLVEALCNEGLVEIARDTISEMELQAAKTNHNAKPGLYAYTTLLAGYLRRNMSLEARKTFDTMRDKGLVPTSITYGVIVRDLAKKSRKEGMHPARKVAERYLTSKEASTPSNSLPSRRVVSGSDFDDVFHPILDRYAKKVEPDRAFEIFARYLRPKGRPPSIPAYTSLLLAYMRAERYESMLEVWNAMYQEVIESLSPQSPSIFVARNLLCLPLSVVMKGLSCDGRLEDLAKIWKRMKRDNFGFDAGNWNNLAVALARHDRVERACWICETVLLKEGREEDATLSWGDGSGVRSSNDSTTPSQHGGNEDAIASSNETQVLPHGDKPSWMPEQEEKLQTHGIRSFRALYEATGPLPGNLERPASSSSTAPKIGNSISVTDPVEGLLKHEALRQWVVYKGTLYVLSKALEKSFLGEDGMTEEKYAKLEQAYPKTIARVEDFQRKLRGRRR